MSSPEETLCVYNDSIGGESVGCQRHVDQKGERCLFHRPCSEKPTGDTLEKFVEELEQAPGGRPIVEDDSPPRFTGAKFRGFEISDTQLAADCSFPLDFRGIEADRFELTSSEVVRSLDLSGAKVEGDVIVKSTVFESGLTGDGVRIEGSLDLTEAKFDRPVSLRGVEIDGDLVLERATFDNRLDCEGIEVGGNLVLDEADFGDGVSFEGAEIVGDITAAETTFGGELNLDEAGLAEVGSLEESINFSNIDVSGKVTCRETHFHSEIQLSDSCLTNSLVIEGSKFDGDFEVTGSELEKLKIEDCDPSSIQFRSNRIHDLIVRRVQARSVRIEGGTIEGQLVFENVETDRDLILSPSAVVRATEVTSLSAGGQVKIEDSKLESRATIQVDRTERGLHLNDVRAGGRLNVGGSSLGGGVDLKESMFEGAVQLQNFITDSVDLTDTQVGERFEVSGVLVESGPFRAEGARFEADCTLEDVRSVGGVNFDRARFAGNLSIEEGRAPAGYSLEDVKIEQDLLMRDLDDEETSSLGTSLSGSSVEGDVSLEDFRTGALDVSGVRVGGDFQCDRLNLGGGIFDAERGRFRGECSWEHLEGGEKVEAQAARFSDGLTIQGGTVAKGISLAEATIDEKLVLSNVEIPESDALELDLAGATVQSGKIEHSAGTLYETDLESATIGDISFECGEGSVYEHLRCHKTQFEGFEFADYQAELADSDWRIHDTEMDEEIPTVEQSPPYDSQLVRFVWYVFAPVISSVKTIRAGSQLVDPDATGSPAPDEMDGADASSTEQASEDGGETRDQVTDDPRLGDDETFEPPADKADIEDLQTTYLKAKNGANRVGARRIASEFFRREMHYRQLLHAANRSERRLPNWVRWTENTTLRLTAGYGERPLRVLGCLSITILVFASVFLSIQPAPVTGILDALLVSIGSFATLLFQHTPQLESQLPQLLAMVEGVVGAIFAALLVFTLTRSVDR